MIIEIPTTEFDIYLRAWQVGDEESLVENANNPKIALNVRDNFPNPYRMEDANFWISLANQQPANFAIVVNEKAVGGIGLVFQEDIQRKNAEIGYWLGENYWNKGIITECIKKVVEYAFLTFDIHRIFAGVFEYNTPSMKVLEKAGFQFECILKEALYKNNTFYDDYIYVKFNHHQ